MSETDVAALLEAAVDSGLAVKREGRISGYTLTAAGQAKHHALLAGETRPDERAAINCEYERFMDLKKGTAPIRYLHGGVDEFCIFERALTATEVAQLAGVKR